MRGGWWGGEKVCFWLEKRENPFAVFAASRETLLFTFGDQVKLRLP